MQLTLGELVRKLRLDEGMTQDELAIRLGISQKTISSWERGRTQPNIEQLSSIAILFGKTIDEIAGTPKTNGKDISLQDMYKKIAAMELPELEELNTYLSNIIHSKLEMDSMLREREMLEKRLKETESELARLKKGTN